jgi:beta-fructofuranosidase
MHTGHINGFEETYGILRRSKDRGLNFESKMVMHDDQRPNENSPVHWDAQVWKHDGYWYQLTGGATGGDDQQGAAWLWRSPDLENWTLLKNIAPSIKTDWYWELPYLIELDSRYLFFEGEEATLENPYWIGDFDYVTMDFAPDANGKRMVENGQYYAFNLHMVDNRGEGDAERRIMHGWVTTCETITEDVPAWSGAHSIPRVLSIKNNRLWQEPIPEIAVLRGKQWDLKGKSAGRKIRKIRGDALEIKATFRAGNEDTVGFKLRISEDGRDYIRTYYDPQTGELGVDGTTINRNHGVIEHPYRPRIVTQKTEIAEGSEIHMHIFLDRSMLEMYVNGYTITSCFFSYPEAKGMDMIASPDGLKKLTIWEMGSLWD